MPKLTWSMKVNYMKYAVFTIVIMYIPPHDQVNSNLVNRGRVIGLCVPRAYTCVENF